MRFVQVMQPLHDKAVPGMPDLRAAEHLALLLEKAKEFATRGDFVIRRPNLMWVVRKPVPS